MKKITLCFFLFLSLFITGYSQSVLGLDKNPNEKIHNNTISENSKNQAKSSNLAVICNPLATLNETFDGVTAPVLPDCWTKIIRGTSINATGTVVQTSSAAADQVFSSPNSVRMFNSSASTATNDIILVSPELSVTSLDTYRMKFYARQSNVPGVIQIGTLDTNTNTATFTPLPDYTALNISKTTTEYTVNFTGYVGTDRYIGIRMSTPSTYTATLIDNVRFEVIPVCPDVTNVIVPSVTSTGATISWTAGGTENSWEVAVGLPNSDPSSLTKYPASINTLDVNGLNSYTTYNVWVRSYCSVGGYGVWVGPITFLTDCTAVATLNQNFDSVTTPQLPSCWSKIIRGNQINSTFTVVNTDSSVASQVSSLPNSVKLSNSSADTQTNDIILVSPNLSTLNSGPGTYRLKFSAKQNVKIGNASIAVGTVNNSTSTATFTPVEVVDISTTATQYEVLAFLNYITDDTHLAFKMNSADTNINIFIDNIIWEPNPTCPDVSQITIPYTTPITATINWTSNEGGTNWQVAVGLPGSDVNSLTPVNVTTNPTTIIGGLTGSTKYNAWVRSVCTGNDYGSWIGPVAFTTACPEVATFDEKFDLVTTPNLPNCWSKIIRGTTSSPYSEVKTVGNHSYSPSNAASIYNAVNSDGNDVILVTPNLSNVFSGNYRLKFYGEYNANGNPATMQVGTLNGNTPNSDFTPIKDLAMTNAYVEYVIDFNNTEGTDTYIGFRLTSVDASTIYLDNIRWEVSPLCPDVSKVIVDSTTPTSASISWSSANVASYEVAIGEVGVDLSTLTPIPTTTKSINIPGLKANTNYNVWVRSVCTDQGNGNWIGPLAFTTTCTAVNSLAESFDGATVPSLPSCWTKILRGPTLSPDAAVFTTVVGSYTPLNSALLRNNNSKDQDDIILVSPNLTTLNGDNHLKFFATGGSSIQIGTLNSNTNAATFNLIEEVLTDVDYKEFNVNFTYNGTDSYIGFRLNSSETYQVVNIDNIYFDNVALSTNQFDIANFNYFPNPVKDILTISTINNISSISIYNILGQEVITKSINGNLSKVDMSNLSKGTYMVKVISDNLTKTIKVIKQ